MLSLIAWRKSAQPGGSHVPNAPISVILAAHNEENIIEQKLRNLSDTAPGVEIFIGLDGCTDRTADIVGDFAVKNPNIVVRVFDRQRGKVAVIKDLVESSSADILVFTDANTMFRQESLNKLVEHFDDPEIGAVCGRLILVGNATTEGIYWRWENRLKFLESLLDSCLGVNGAIYAIRRELFWRDIPVNTIVDDFVIGMKVREQGGRVIYEHAAVGEETLPSASDEWKRRIRIGAGDYQALGLCRKCLLPGYGKFAWMFWSHKALRWFTPHLIVIVVAASIFRAISTLRRFVEGMPVSTEGMISLIIIACSLLGLLCAAVGRFVKNRTEPRSAALRFLCLCDHFVAMQTALFIGFLRFCRGNLEGIWDRTPR